MDEAWGSGDPTEFIDDIYYIAYDGHIYLKWAGIETKEAYINTSCTDLLDDSTPTIVGEWSLSVADDTGWNPDWGPELNTDFYKRWFAAQAITYEKREGWIFWTWKARLGDYRWSYKGLSSSLPWVLIVSVRLTVPCRCGHRRCDSNRS